MYANDPSIHIKKIKEQKAEERNNKTNINEIWKCEKSKNKTKPKLFFLKNHEIDSILVRLMKKKRKDTSKQCQKWKGR